MNFGDYFLLQKQALTTEGRGKCQLARDEETSQGPPPAKKRRGRKPKTQPPSLSTSAPSSDVEPGTGGVASTPARTRVSRTLRNYIGTPTTTAGNRRSTPRDSAVGEGDTTENLEGREGELAMLEKMFEYVWSTYYASVDKISSAQIKSALKIFFERGLTAVRGDE